MKKKVASRTCHFCGGPDAPGQRFYKDVHVTADHVLKSKCWEAIQRLRTDNPVKLATLMAPTKDNFEWIRLNKPGCKTAYETNRFDSRRKYDDDESTHNAFCVASVAPSLSTMSLPNIPHTGPQGNCCSNDGLKTDNENIFLLFKYTRCLIRCDTRVTCHVIYISKLFRFFWPDRCERCITSTVI